MVTYTLVGRELGERGVLRFEERYSEKNLETVVLRGAWFEHD